MNDLPQWLQEQIAQSGDGVVIGACFSFNSPFNFLAKVIWESERAKACHPGTTLDRIFHAMNFAVSAWHMHDWLWAYADDDLKKQWSEWFQKPIGSARSFGDVLAEIWPVLAACKEIANTIKHGILHKPDPNISAIGERAVYPGGEDWIPIIRIGDERIIDVDFYDQVIGVWSAFLAHSRLLPEGLNEHVLGQT